MTVELLTTLEVARLLGLHPNSVSRLCQQERLKARKVGRDWVITGEAVAEFEPLLIRLPQLLSVRARLGKDREGALADTGGRDSAVDMHGDSTAEGGA